MKHDPYLRLRAASGTTPGSFWYETVSAQDKSLVSTLVGLNSETSAVTTLDAAISRAVNNAPALERNIELQLKPEDITVLGPDLQAQIAMISGDVVFLRADTVEDARTLLSVGPVDAQALTALTDAGWYTRSVPLGTGDLTVQPGQLRTRWLVRIPPDVEPLVIRSQSGELVRGSGFTGGEGYIVLDTNPELLYHAPGVLHLAAARVRRLSLFGYPAQADNLRTSNGTHVVNYLRLHTTPALFRLAIAEVAGLTVAPRDEIILHTLPAGSGWVYVCAGGRVEARYAHTPLAAGTTLRRGRIIGDGVRVYAATLGGSNWWHGVDWGNGLSLDGLCPWPGITVDPGLTTIEVWDITDEHVRVRPHYSFPDSATQTAFWNSLAAAEVATGVYLNDLLPAEEALATIGQTGSARMFDLLFQQLLGLKALVVELDTEALGEMATARVKAFAMAEVPVGAVLILKDRPTCDNTVRTPLGDVVQDDTGEDVLVGVPIGADC